MKSDDRILIFKWSKCVFLSWTARGKCGGQWLFSQPKYDRKSDSMEVLKNRQISKNFWDSYCNHLVFIFFSEQKMLLEILRRILKKRISLCVTGKRRDWLWKRSVHAGLSDFWEIFSSLIQEKKREEFLLFRTGSDWERIWFASSLLDHIILSCWAHSMDWLDIC